MTLASCIPEGTLLITGLEVRNVEEPGSEMQIEVHLFDADSAEYLGCSGHKSGLVKVKESETRYPLQARFQDEAPIDYGEPRWLSADQLSGRSLVFVVVENDVNHCPVRYHRDDDVLGVSPVIAHDGLSAPALYSFDRVDALILELR